MGSFKQFVLAEDKRSRTKKFEVFKNTPHAQVMDVETVRNIIVHKIGRMLSPRMNKPVEEIADNIRLRKIVQMGTHGNHFHFRYSLYNRPFAQYRVEINPQDFALYSTPDFKTKGSEEAPPVENKNEKVYKCKFPDEYGDVVFNCKCTPEDPNVDLETLKKTESESIKENFNRKGKFRIFERMNDNMYLDRLSKWGDIVQNSIAGVNSKLKSPKDIPNLKELLINRFADLLKAGFKSGITLEQLKTLDLKGIMSMFELYDERIQHEKAKANGAFDHDMHSLIGAPL